MREIYYKQVENGKETIQVVLQFPDKTQNITKIQKEVKEILFFELQNQIKRGRDFV